MQRGQIAEVRIIVRDYENSKTEEEDDSTDFPLPHEQHDMPLNEHVQTYDLMNRREGRRPFLKRVGKTVFVSALSVWGSYIATGLSTQRQQAEENAREERDTILARICGAYVEDGVALVPAAHHPFKTPKEIKYTEIQGKTVLNRTSFRFYEVERRCGEAYYDKFYKSRLSIRSVENLDDVFEDETAILFGSQVSNWSARDILGSPWRNDVNLDVKMEGGSVELMWNLVSPIDADNITYRHYMMEWRTKPHLIEDRQGRIYQALFKDNVPNTDYLLVTAIPRKMDSAARVIVFSGVHAAGTLATKFLLERPPDSVLEALHDARLGAYFQVLFKVNVAADSNGHPHPVGLELVDCTNLLTKPQQIESMHGDIA